MPRDWRDMEPADFDTDVDAPDHLFPLTPDIAPPPVDDVGTGDLLAELNTHHEGDTDE